MDVQFTDLSWDLRFHHHASDLPSVEPRIAVCADSLYEATSVDVCLDVRRAEKLGYPEPRTQTELMHFCGSLGRPITLRATPAGESAIGMFSGGAGSVPRDTRVLFWVYATHINEDQFPSQVCVGMGGLNVHELWKEMHTRGKTTLRVSIGNRARSVGSVEVTVAKPSFLSFHDGHGWGKTQTPTLSVDEEARVAREHAAKESAWVATFEKVWGNVDNMVDLYGFLIGGFGLPISYFLTRNRAELREKEWKVLLYYALRRYAVEKSRPMGDVVADFRGRKLPFLQRCAILAEMITLPVHSHAYMTDYVISDTGDYKLIEIFQAAGRSGSGDCEDFARQMANLWDTFCATIFRDPLLAELRAIARMHIAVVSLDRTTVPRLGVGGLGAAIRGQFRSAMEKRMAECQGTRRDVTAHMNVFAVPRGTFFALTRPDLNASTADVLGSIASTDKEDFADCVESYRETYDDDFDEAQLRVIVLEGTGNFNAVDEADPHAEERRFLGDERFEALALGKHKIYHPVGDPKQFYLNPLLFITPYFLKRYRVPLTTFVCAYENGDRLIYGVTYADLMRQSRDVCLVPMEPLTRRELVAAVSAARRNYRHPFGGLRETARISTLADVGQQEDPFTDLAVEEWRETIGGTTIDSESRAFRAAMARAQGLAAVVNEARRGAHGTTRILVAFSYLYFASDAIMHDLQRDLMHPRVKAVGVYAEVFGEGVRNIVLIISM